jgi:hypothetical protein
MKARPMQPRPEVFISVLMASLMVTSVQVHSVTLPMKMS